MIMANEPKYFVPIPQTNGEGVTEYNYVQFVTPRLDYNIPDWFGNLAYGVSQNRINRCIAITGYPQVDPSVFRSGPTIDFEWCEDNLPQGTSQSQAIDLYAVEFPDSIDVTMSAPDQLVVKAYRSPIYSNRKIGNTEYYGNYINETLGVYRRRFVNGVATDTRLTTNTITAQIYQGGAVDVGMVESRLEFFYLDETLKAKIIGSLFGFSQQLNPEYWEAFQVGDFFLGISTCAAVPSNGTFWTNYTLWCPEHLYFDNYIDGNPTGKEADPVWGDASDTGGYDKDAGTHDFHSDDITRTDNPTLSVLSSGFYNLYKVTSGFLANLGRAIFPPPIIDSDNLVDALNSLCANLYNSKLIDYFIDCHIVPVDIPSSGSGRIRAGGKELVNVDNGQYYAAPLVSNAYVSKSCGSVSIPEAFGNFLDYTVKCKLYLPCYGYVDIPAEYWNGGTISVEYCFNVIDGSFVAFVSGRAKHSKLNSLIGQYSGCAVTHIPIRGADYSNIMSGLISVGIGTAATIATGHIASQNAFRSAMTSAQMNMIGKAAGSPEADIIAQRGALAAQTSSDSVNFSTAGSAASQLSSGLANVLSMKPTMVNNGTANASSSMMMHKKPYLIIEYPTPQFSTMYPNEMGLPLNVAAPLGQYGGMTIAENPILDGIPCTATEKARIRAALASGLIFR